MVDGSGGTFTIDITFDDVKTTVTQLTWNNTSTVCFAIVTLTQPGKPTQQAQVAAFGQTPGPGQQPSSGSVNIPASQGGYTYDPTGDNPNAAQLSSAWC